METMDLQFNPDDMTLGDLEDFEEIVGKTIDEAFKPVPVLDDEGKRVFDDKGRPEMTVKMSTKAIICLVYLVKRKVNADFTLADARNVRITSLVLGATESDDQGNV